ncbi:Hint domain-containing protein [Streptomyces sp. NPDC050504]|uniref:Hint domain-containing protein n=1 Tax=Streptomyces sp. NPDC050504 TaxID=3365618 RepID=UPI0037BC7044
MSHQGDHPRDPRRTRGRSRARRAGARTDTRLVGLRRTQSGQGALEYLGLVLIVAAIIGSLVATGIGAELSQRIGTEVCRLTGGGNCGGGDGDGGEPRAQGPDGTKAPGSTDDPASPAQIAYDQALKELQDAKRDEKSDSDKALEAAKELADILAEELGIKDALACITQGDMGACTETLVNVLLSLIGGAVAKLAKKYGMPWKWKKAAGLIKRLKRHGGDLYDGLKGLIKNRKRVAEAEGKLAEARKKLDAEKQKKPHEPDPKDDPKPDPDKPDPDKPDPDKPDPDKPDPDKPGDCLVGHSFPPGTPVLRADGTRVPIESVRIGDRVLATDPRHGRTERRRVTHTFVTHDDKDFTRLGTAAGTVTATDTHPFWLTGERRWAEAGGIEAGDVLRLPDGSGLRVTSVARYTQRQTTFDLAVDGIHAYYVGIGSASALVHNNNPCKEWQTDPGVKGPAAGKKLKPPHPRHSVAGARNGMVKEKNTVILKGREADVEADIQGIAEGRAKLVDNGSAYEINGRKYGVEDNGRTFPISGKGLVELDRNEYAALKEIAKAGGRTDVPALTRNPRFANNPGVVEKAKQVYDGTYK